MQTQTIYSALVNRRKTHPATGRVEKHHIVPKSLGGSDNKSNLVSLTPREHYVAHRLLAKMHGGPMWAALAFMSRGAVNSAAGVVVPSRVYALAKQKDAEWRVDRYKGEGNPFYGKTFTEEQPVKLRGKRVSVEGKNNPNYGGKRSDATKRKISESQRGKNNPFFGKKHSPESKKKMSKIKKLCSKKISWVRAY